METNFITKSPFSFEVANTPVKWYFKRLTPLTDSSILAFWGDTVVNVSILRGEGTEENTFLPLQVEYLEKYYAAGIIASSPYVKREGHPSDAAILKARIIDRAIRPRFPKTLRDVIQVYVSVLSYDVNYDPLLLAFNTTVAALMTSTIPFEGNFAGVKITLDEKGNPTPLYKDIPLWDDNGNHKADITSMDFFLGVDEQGVIMVDAFFKEVPEAVVKKAVEFSKELMYEWFNPIKEFAEEFKQEKTPGCLIEVPEELLNLIRKDFEEEIEQTLREKDKVLRREKLEELPDKVVEFYLGESNEQKEAEEEFAYSEQQVRLALEKLLKQYVKDLVLKQKERVDGRGFEEVRPLAGDVGFLPRVHGSAVFKRGDTMVFSATTLGSLLRQLQLDSMTGEEERRFIHEYYSPPYGFGEPGRYRVYPGRREIGHGALAEKALLPVIPSAEEFPYMIRVVSEVVSSAGSTSMASATAASMSLMDAGVPIKRSVTGISIGVIGNEDFSEYQLLTDIVEVEDFYGEMDFKVAGTSKGITAIQMDQKRLRIPYNVIIEALDKAKNAREFLLSEIAQVIKGPRATVSEHAPKVVQFKIPVEEIGKVIGPGGRVIKDIMERTDTVIHIDEDGTVSITGPKADGLETARTEISGIASAPGKEIPQKEYHIGEIYDAEVVEIKPFGLIVKLLDGTDTLAFVHISEVADFYVKDINKLFKVGEHVRVKIIDFDEKGRLRASIKQVEE